MEKKSNTNKLCSIDFSSTPRNARFHCYLFYVLCFNGVYFCIYFLYTYLVYIICMFCICLARIWSFSNESVFDGWLCVRMILMRYMYCRIWYMVDKIGYSFDGQPSATCCCPHSFCNKGCLIPIAEQRNIIVRFVDSELAIHLFCCSVPVTCIWSVAKLLCSCVLCCWLLLLKSAITYKETLFVNVFYIICRHGVARNRSNTHLMENFRNNLIKKFCIILTTSIAILQVSSIRAKFSKYVYKHVFLETPIKLANFIEWHSRNLRIYENNFEIWVLFLITSVPYNNEMSSIMFKIELIRNAQVS